jgi:sugar lactone lactonase YvrE
LGAAGIVPEITVTRANVEVLPGDTSDFGAVPAGGTAPVDFVISNPGFRPLTINSVALAGGSQGFSIVNPGIVGTSLAPGASATLTVAFNPLTIGDHADTLTITSNAGGIPSYQIELHGSAFPQAPTARLTLNKDNNLGGVALHDGQPALVSDLATITNDGAQPLSLSAIQVADGAAAFTLTGLPADLTTNPIVLAHGQSFTFGVQFTPDKVGLERALIRATTNDPNNPVLRFSAMGTGLADTVYPHWGDDFVAIETPKLAGSFALRARSDNQGNFSFFLPPDQPYHLVIFDPQTGLVAHGYGTTPDSGRGIDLSANLVFGPSTAPDEAGNGLPDDVKFAVGTSLTKVDTTGDGIDDFTKIAEGLDPLGGRGVPTGVIASLALNGEAQKVVVQGSAQDPQAQTAYVATGSYGLAVVDVSRFNQPRLLSQLPLPGNNLGVSLDPVRNQAAVAAGPAGLHVVDVSDPLHPVAGPTVALANGAQAVSVFDGVAYVASGPDLVGIDPVTGQVSQTLSFGGGASLTALAGEGTTLYTVDRQNTLRAVDVSGPQMVARGSLALPAGGGGLFVGNGIAFVGAGNGNQEGFVTVDVSDPDLLSLLGGVQLNSVGGRMVVANGSGLAVAVGTPRLGTGSDSTNTPVLDVMDVSNPGNTGAFRTQFSLPSSPLGVAIASGVAFVADGPGGLRVVNYVPFDTRGVSPTVTVSAPTADVDPNTPGIQVVQGSTVQVQATVRDDVQVRDVELLVNGRVVRKDVSFPFDLSFVAPNLTAGSNTVRVQVRATDTGGNASLSDPLVMQLVSGIPAFIRSTTPADGTTAGAGLQQVQVLFSRPMAAATVTTSTVQLLDGAGNPVPPRDLGLHQDDQLVQLGYAPLPVGSYQLVIDAAAVTDRVGTPLGAAAVRSHFRLVAVVTGGEPISTVAGNGAGGYSGDHGPATQAELSFHSGVAVGADGSLYIADTNNQRVRRVGPDGIITTVAGNGTAGYGGDGGPAQQAQLSFPEGILVGADGSLYIADTGNQRVRRVGPDGVITTVAGNGTAGYGGDTGPAPQARLNLPDGVALGPDGSLYIADPGNERVRRVGPDGVIRTVAGNGTGGFSGDGGPATQAQLHGPAGIAVGPDGSLYIADKGNQRVRRVGPDGVISTVAGSGTAGYGGDGGPAQQAQLFGPTGVAVGADGSLYIADEFNTRVRRVGPDGVITTVAGNGTAGYAGDHGPATQAELAFPTGVAVGPDGSLYIADLNNSRVRKVESSSVPPTILSINPADGTSAGAGLQLVQVQFSKSLAAATVTTSTFQLLDGVGNRVAPLSLSLHQDDQLVQLSTNPLPAGRYQLVQAGKRVYPVEGDS